MKMTLGGSSPSVFLFFTDAAHLPKRVLRVAPERPLEPWQKLPQLMRMRPFKDNLCLLSRNPFDVAAKEDLGYLFKSAFALWLSKNTTEDNTFTALECRGTPVDSSKYYNVWCFRMRIAKRNKKEAVSIWCR